MTNAETTQILKAEFQKNIQIFASGFLLPKRNSYCTCDSPVRSLFC